MKMLTKSQVAKKAVRTHKARKEFVSSFGKDTFDILMGLAGNKPMDNFPKMKVAAVKAHLTMGTYAPFVKKSKTGKIIGTCNL